MNKLNLQQALTEAELDRLTNFLETIGPNAMNIEMLDGYFSALICGPSMISPSEYLIKIWGDNFEFDNDAQATEVIGLIMRHWNTIASTLSNSLKESDVYFPILMEGDDGIAHGNDWALGFMRGVHTRMTDWRDLIEDEEHGGLMFPIMFLAHENDPDLTMRPPPVADEKREELIKMMIVNLTMIYRFFELPRQSFSGVPLYASIRREGPKIGRNDPCPCGSGRKFKYCCASNAPTMH